MKYLKFSNAGAFACFLLFAAQAFAQFEVSPDHVDDQSLNRAKSKTNIAKTDSKKKADSRLYSSPQAATAHPGKPHPGRKSGSAEAAATKGTTATRHRASSTSSAQAAPSLKTQAASVRRE